MPPRSTAALPTRFFPTDPETTDLTLPTPPIEFSLPADDGGGGGGPGPSSLAHRLAAASHDLLGVPSDLHVNGTAAGPPSTTSRKRKAVTPSTVAGTRQRVQRTDQVDDDSASSGKGKGKRSQTAAASAKMKGKATSSTSTAQDIRVQPSSEVEENSSDQDGSGPRSEGEKRQRRDSEASGNGAASDDAALSDAYTDDDGSSEGGDSAEAAVEFSEEEAQEPVRRRKPGRRRRDSPSYVESLHRTGPTAGGPGYEGFVATLLGGGGAASNPASKVWPPIVPPLLQGTEDLKALLLASVEDEDEEGDDGVGGIGGGMDAEGSGGVHHQRPPAKSRPGLTTNQLAELERASNPAFATILLEKVAGRISALDTAYAKLSQELSKAQLEASVLGNVKSLLKARRDIIRKPPT